MKKTKRKSKFSISDIILHRWSPRAFSKEDVTDKELKTLFEAARWAPSSYNGQPWRFVYARRGTKQWQAMFDLLVDFNKSWAKNAAVLVLIISRTTFEFNNESSRTHSFDTGAAWQNLALQATVDNLVVHGMEGFDYNKARGACNIPKLYDIEAMVAVGRLGSVEDLPHELQDREQPSDRKSLEDFVFEGIFRE